MQRLKTENSQMKNFISQARANAPYQVLSPNKQQLRNELNELRQKVEHYSYLINRARSDLVPDEFSDLLMQSNKITAEGQRLMKVKSNPSTTNDILDFRSGGQLEHIAE